MTEERRYEKEEKEEKSRGQEEKEDEKQYEKQQPEKRWDEKWERDPIGTLTWPLIFIWAGVAFLLENLGILDNLGFLKRVEAWPLILAGAGFIVLGIAVVRLLMPEHRRPVTGSIIVGFLLVGAGLGEMLGSEIIWPILIVAAGVVLLMGGFLRRR